MTVFSTTLAPLRQYLEAPPKKLLIDGAWVGAASGETIDSINPSTGQTIASVAAGDQHDVVLAVAAARRAFEGPWSKYSPMQRQNLLLRLAELVEAHSDELRLLDVVDMGAPISRLGGPEAPPRSCGTTQDGQPRFTAKRFRTHPRNLYSAIP